jgi:DNA-binding transcriptional MerR regulator
VLFKKRQQDQTAPDAAPQPEGDLRTAQPNGAIPAQFRSMKRQLSSSDVRTDRLVRQLRDEIDGVRTLLDAFADDQEELLTVDPEAVASDPKAASSLPGPILVRTIIALEEERAQAVERASALEQDVESLAAQIIELRLSEAGLRGRLQTYDDVIAALHGNLEDLRYARDHSASIQAEPARLRLKAVHDADEEPPAAASAP